MPQTYISPHNKIGYLFLSLTVLFIVNFIFGVFGSFYGAQIIITPETEEISINSSIKISEEKNTSTDLILKGKIVENIQTGEKKSFPQATVSAEDYAEGEIILKNNNSSALNFVASTRFASPEGLIFRAVNRIYVAPKGGETTVLVKAEKMGAEYDIGPAQFTIPNLKDSALKDNIIAESKKPMTGGLKKTGIIMQSDIDQAKKELKETLYQKGLTEIEKEINSADFKIVIQSNILEEKSDALAGEEKIEFTVQEKIKIGAVAFKENDISKIAVEILKNNVPQGKTLIAYELKSLNYRLIEYDLENKTALLEIQFRGYMSINNQYEFLEKTRFRGLTKQEVENYLNEFSEIKEIKIKFWPPLLFKTMPQSIDKIKIKINI
ncbi:MAG: hypothetical protein PHW15_00475 [Patescibacteria group bacterium]|jgi:hypothetical protein|nr:hypothetical protein [Patescibacteria group bacterium]